MSLTDRRVIFRLHAVRRMFQRRITHRDVHQVLETGEVLEQYPHDTPYPSRLLLGWRDARPLHVVVAEDSEAGTAIVVTVYEPDPVRWDSDFRRRVQ